MEAFFGRRILFIGIGFYDYESCIVEELREKGAKVVSLVDRPWILRHSVLAGLCRQFNWLYNWLIRRHERYVVNGAKNESFDQVLIIKSVDLSVGCISRLREIQSKAKFILYLWDSLPRLHGIEERLPLFDRVLTFDRRDAEANPNFIFRPLFYRHGGGDKRPDACVFDISFVGWLHTQRLEAVRNIETQAKELGLNAFIYLYTGFFTWVRLMATGKARGVFFWAMPYRRLIEINKNSRCIFDFPHPDQSGLTMRAIEALGMKKKLITTSRDIMNYNFFSPENIYRVEYENLKIDKKFLDSASHIVPEVILRQYSLSQWISDVLN